MPRPTALSLLVALMLIGAPDPIAADTAVGSEADDTTLEQEIVTFAADFFARYRPNTALEMVSQVPGFLIDDGADKRGFNAAAGNILINDRYPSAKQDRPSNILERIPANQVERIELIRGQGKGIDLRGQQVVANVILRDDIPASGRWDLAIRKTADQSPLTVRGAVSVSDAWRSIEYNAGAQYRRFRSGESGTEEIADPGGDLLEIRNRQSFLQGDEGNLNVNLLTWVGEFTASFNAQVGFEDRIDELSAVGAPQAPGSRSDDFFVDDDERKQLELGTDIERNFHNTLLARGILLYTRQEDDRKSSQRRLDSAGVETLFRVAASNVVQTESIARIELYWARTPNHAVNINAEGVRNVIDGSLTQTVDTGSGPIDVPVPGANTRVQEDRFDALVNGTSYKDEFEIAYGMGAEASTISQSGDAESDRSFFFLKPQFYVSYSPSLGRQTRVRFAREVSQLDFSDFVSSTVFQDDDLALGNPDLEPESTWVAELSEERRFGELGVVRATLFHHWISDVQDLLPVTPEFEVPGNIGAGRRWGLELDATLPLDAVGLGGARLDIEARLQDSVVRDPVDGDDRVLSGEEAVGKPLLLEVENRYAFAVDFRQDLEGKQFAWGWDIRKRGDRYAFRVNELVRYEDGIELNVFAETTRWLGLRIRVEGANLLDFEQVRDRTLYVDERNLSPIDVIELRNITDGRRVIVSMSGTF